ncbi:MAG TPA: GIY-YIG nuclease family protein [Noviherbaspirillum sp.]|nr:GIY-YIG nuclease family protein [Noviherbaspirillum sp.]
MSAVLNDEKSGGDRVKTALYRHFDKDGILLYVGISLSALTRLGQHRENAHWFNSISDVKMEFFDSRQEAIAAEKAAIKSERPRHNIIHAEDIPQATVMNAALRERLLKILEQRIIHINPAYKLDDAALALGLPLATLKKMIDQGLISCVELIDGGTRRRIITGWQIIDALEYMQSRKTITLKAKD